MADEIWNSEIRQLKAAMLKEESIDFANWIHKYASKMGHKWGVYGTDKPIRSTEELYEMYTEWKKKQ
jgi:hypothetical protein